MIYGSSTPDKTQHTLTLSEADLREAIGDWLTKKGVQCVTLEAGCDQGEVGSIEFQENFERVEGTDDDEESVLSATITWYSPAPRPYMRHGKIHYA